MTTASHANDDFPLIRIFSGGQVGADRGALDAAIEADLRLGGWAAEGRRSEDGVVPKKYKLRALSRGAYDVRTKRNVVDTNATIIITFGPLSDINQIAQELCQRFHKKLLIIDAPKTNQEAAAKQIVDFIRENGVKIVHVTGTRDSENARAYKYAFAVMKRVFKEIPEKARPRPFNL